MTLNDVRRTVHEIAQEYFGDIPVVFGRQSQAVKPKKAFVCLSFGDVRRATYPPETNEGGIPIKHYPALVSVQVDLFSRGRKLEIDGMTAADENTAADELLGFCDFLDSHVCQWMCERADIAIVQDGGVRDLTGLITSTTWEYRAMVTLDVRFTMDSPGVRGFPSDDDGWFENVEINNKLIKEKSQ